MLFDFYVVGFYIIVFVFGSVIGLVLGDKKLVLMIECKFFFLIWNFVQCGQLLDRKDCYIVIVMVGICNKYVVLFCQKEVVLFEDFIVMLEMFDCGVLCGLCDCVMFLFGFVGGLCCFEVVGFDVGCDQIEDFFGWIEIFDKGMLLCLCGKIGWCEVEVGCGFFDVICLVVVFEIWFKFVCIVYGFLFWCVIGWGKVVGVNWFNDQEVVCLVK